MPHNNWDDEHIENLLRDFPAIRDDRPKEEVYQRLAQKEPVRKRQKQWLPLLVAALAFITIGILVASILNQSGIDSSQNEQSTESGSDQSAASTAETAEDRSIQEENAATGDAATSIMESEDAGSGQVSVYEGDLEGHTLFTIGFTENAFVIPLSFLIPDSQIMEDLGKDNPNSVELYNQYASEIDEQALGFDEYHPYVGKIAMGSEGAEHVLPKDHQYDLASASIGVYTATLKETFRDAGQVAVLNEDGSPVEFDQIGPMEPVVTDVKNVAFYAYTTAAGETFLAPGYGMPFETATEAFQAMKDSPNDFQKSTLPDGTDFSITETDDLVQIEFQSPFDFSAMEEVDAKRMIESLAMTAKSYGKQVQLANIEQPQWLGYDFTVPLETPVATNNTPWTIK
ncbi:hypothetical protein HU147_13810 [Planomicrobium chinense]|uniref:hypothetical protein n=1 Tax=Planococcus chinensis TaxID=272917 RepID=UPI001CC41A1A|nr:hypothetical protein [Planococcus chinensis]MBZ5202298.1 hypothetical protein [Planococcus chinensis]